MIVILLGAAPVAAAPPTVTFDPGNPPIVRFSNAPLLRNWTWHCNDPDNQVPISHRCWVYDVTQGTIGSGKEVLRSDVDCGTSATNPSSATYAYDVTGPVNNHRYAYGITCKDSAGESKGAFNSFWYDNAAPLIMGFSGPWSSTTDPDATFQFGCYDTSLNVKATPPPRCWFYCSLTKAPGGPGASVLCGEAVLTASTVTYQLPGLTPGSYKLTVVAIDEAGNVSQPEEHNWKLIGPDAGPVDAGLVDSASSDAASGDAASSDGARPDQTVDQTVARDVGLAADVSPAPDAASDAAVSHDAAASRDAAVGRDATAAADGKLAVDSKPTPSADPGGCSCNVHSKAGAGSLVSLALLSLLAVVLRRRRVPKPARRG